MRRPYYTSLNLTYSEILALPVRRRDMLMERLMADWDKERPKKK